MTIKVLCTPDFTAREFAEIDATAKRLDTSREDVVRRAVALYSAMCVPTQRKARETAK